MKKIYALEQGTDSVRYAAFMMLAALALLLAACETAPHRTELAMAPPAFVPMMEASTKVFTQEIHTVLRTPTVAMIEPAAGNVETNASCLQVGNKGDDALFYQWGENRLGVDVASYSGGDRYEDHGEAKMRYSISLQKNRSNSGCSDNSTSFRFSDIF